MPNNLNFYTHGFYANPEGEIYQKINQLDAPRPGIFKFVEVEENEETESKEPTWLLQKIYFDKRIVTLWYGKLSCQEILDAVAIQFT
jgi:hypothetical protein